jgi:hypothetical protein
MLEALAIDVITYDVLPTVTARHHVVDRAGVLNPESSSHALD